MRIGKYDCKEELYISSWITGNNNCIMVIRMVQPLDALATGMHSILLQIYFLKVWHCNLLYTLYGTTPKERQWQFARLRVL